MESLCIFSIHIFAYRKNANNKIDMTEFINRKWQCIYHLIKIQNILNKLNILNILNILNKCTYIYTSIHIYIYIYTLFFNTKRNFRTKWNDAS